MNNSNSTQEASSSSQPRAYILYVDHQGHPAPLTEHFHATASRRLSSTVYRYPLSTTTEVDSAYCPQCLTFFDTAKATNLGFCDKATCRLCPVCFSVASIQTSINNDEDQHNTSLELFYQCGQCHWTSKQSGISLTMAASETIDRVELLRGAEDLALVVAERRQQALQYKEGLHQGLSDAWVHYRFKKHDNKQHTSDWSVELLESKLKNVTDSIKADHSNYELPNGCRRVTIQDILSQPERGEISSLYNTENCSLLSYQMSQSYAGGDVLLPLPIPLRTRLSRRCRAELADGRPGILLKPKLNPLEGDSSLQTGHGQWNRKDCSAIHVIPRVEVVQCHHMRIDYHDNYYHNIYAFLLKVSNPTLGTVRLRLTQSSYCGEVQHWDDDNVVLQETDDKVYSKTLRRVLVDTITQTIMDVQLLDPAQIQSYFIDRTTIELKSAEDSILELGTQSRDVPISVQSWDPKTVAGPLQLVAQTSSDAWLELALPIDDHDVHNEYRKGNAIGLSMEVELGNGSWESSLITVQEGLDGSDYVLFDLVLTWTM